MTRYIRLFATIVPILTGIGLDNAASAQKRGGVLTMFSLDSPGGLSMLEEATVFSMGPMAGVFNNLIMFNQHVKHNSMESIVPDLAHRLVLEHRSARADLSRAPGCPIS